MSILKNKTLFITGSSRGIGREIALRCAREGANIIIAAKSDQPHPKLEGTIHTVAKEVEEAGGQALALKLDVRDDAGVVAAMKQAADHFGSLDILVNNAGSIRLTNVENTPLKRYDLIHSINDRAVLSCSQAALPYLKTSAHAHILNLSPPINLDPKWMGPYAPYTKTKYGMTLLTLGMAEEFRDHGIAVNALWPRTTIATAAIEFEVGKTIMERSRTPQIMADAAYEVLTSTDLKITGQALLDEDILRAAGQTEFDHYAYKPGCTEFMPDLYVD